MAGFGEGAPVIGPGSRDGRARPDLPPARELTAGEP